MSEHDPTEHYPTKQNATEPRTALDKFFAALRGLGIQRRTDDKWIAGVCSGVADRLGVDPVIVRAAVVLLSLLGGFGVTVYLVAWALLPNDRGKIVAERALRDGDGGSVVLIVIAAFALFGGSGWGHSGWQSPWGLLLTGVLVWWLIRRSGNRPDTSQRVNAQSPGTQSAAGPSPSQSAAGQSPTTAGPVVPRKPRRRSGGPLMALLAVGLALVTYGSLIWLGTRFSWTGNHEVIAMAGSLATIGLLLVGLGLAGWRAGFVAFLAVVLAISAWSSTVVPAGLRVGGPVGDATWAPTSVVPGASYHQGIGNGVLNLSGLPPEGLRAARIPASVGIGDLTVIVPQGLTVQVVGHVGLGQIVQPGETEGNGQGGTDIHRLVVIGDGPTEVMVDAEVGVGQLTVVKE
jgi:phage shock protein PspC (stress-responsive transcriptional regulator)